MLSIRTTSVHRTPDMDQDRRTAARALLWLEVVLRGVIVASLVLDAKIHLHLAPAYDQIRSSTVSQGTLFRVEAALAIAAALLVVLARRPLSALVALAVAGGGLVPLLVYRYYDLGSLGPLPAMYEPAWYPDKTHTCIAQAVAAAAALMLLGVALVRRRNNSPAPIHDTSRSELPL